MSSTGKSPLEAFEAELRQMWVRPVRAFGRFEYRPDCEASRIFCELLNQKSLTEANIEVLKKFGYTVGVKGGTL